MFSVKLFGCDGTERAVGGAETDGVVGLWSLMRAILTHSHRRDTEIGCFGQVMRFGGWQTGSVQANALSRGVI